VVACFRRPYQPGQVRTRDENLFHPCEAGLWVDGGKKKVWQVDQGQKMSFLGKYPFLLQSVP